MRAHTHTAMLAPPACASVLRGRPRVFLRAVTRRALRARAACAPRGAGRNGGAGAACCYSGARSRSVGEALTAAPSLRPPRRLLACAAGRGAGVLQTVFQHPSSRRANALAQRPPLQTYAFVFKTSAAQPSGAGEPFPRRRFALTPALLFAPAASSPSLTRARQQARARHARRRKAQHAQAQTSALFCSGSQLVCPRPDAPDAPLQVSW